MRLIIFAFALLLSTSSLQALAETYPSKPIKLVIPFAAGSANPHLYKSLPYDPVRNFEPIARVGKLKVLAGTPQPIVARLAQETLSSLAQADVRQRLAALGFEVDPLEPMAFGRYVREQLEPWGKLIRAATIQPE